MKRGSKKKVNSDKEGDYIGKIFLTKTKILKVLSETETTVSGFDLISESAFQVKKKCLIPILPSIKFLISSEFAKLHVALSQSKNIKGVGVYLKYSDRTIFRMMKEHGLTEEEEE